VKNLGKILLILIVLAVGGFIALAMVATVLSLPILGLDLGLKMMPRMVAGPMLFVAGVCVILLFAFLALKALGSATAADGTGLSADEARLMQELNSGMARLEERVEALETLLLDASRPAGPGRRSNGRRPDSAGT